MLAQRLLGLGGGLTLYQAIVSAGLTSNLKLCLDAADTLSYSSGQSWLDRSGGGYDFFLGTTSGAESTDPVFTGPIGGSLSYWDCNGDFFTYDSTNETWMDALHKDNAQFTLLQFVNLNSNDDFIVTSSGPPGIKWSRSATFHKLVVLPGLTVTSDNAISTGAWHMLGVSIDETGASGFFYKDGSYDQVSASDTFNATYASPSASAAAQTMTLPGGAAIQSLAACAIWSAALTKANLDSIYNLMRGRFSI